MKNQENKCKKTAFRDEIAANFSLAKIKKVSNNVKYPIRAYKCTLCGLWHLTSRKDVKDIEKRNLELENENFELRKKIAELTDADKYKIRKDIKRDNLINQLKHQFNLIAVEKNKIMAKNKELVSEIYRLRNLSSGEPQIKEGPCT